MSIGSISCVALSTLSDQEKQALAVPMTSNIKELDPLTEPNKKDKCKTCGGVYFSDVRSIKNKCRTHASLIELPFYLPNHVHIKILKPLLGLLCPHCPNGIKIKYDLLKNYIPNVSITANIKAFSNLKCEHDITYFIPEEVEVDIGKNIMSMNYFIMSTTKKYTPTQMKKVSINDVKLAGEEVYTILKNLPKYFYPALGIKSDTLSNLGDMITNSIIVSPPYLRAQMPGQISQYLSAYKKIIAANDSLKNLMIIDDNNRDFPAILNLMSQIIAHHIIISGDNGSSNKTAIKIANKENSNSMIPSYLEGLGGKKGDARKVIVNKRTDSGARVLLNGGCYLHGDLIQIPLDVAITCCVNITINTFNISECRNLVINGIYGIYPGAYKIITNTNHEYIVKDNPAALAQVQVGYIIQRQAMDGDVVISLRFPAHHENSFTAAFIRITHEMSVRIPPCWNKKIGGDYDGDELNLMFLLNKSSAYEAMVMLSASKQMMATSYSRLWVFADFDGDVDMLYTATRVFVTRKWTYSEFMQCIAEVPLSVIKKDVLKQMLEWCNNGTAFNITSLVIPELINLKYASSVKKWWDKKQKILKDFPYVEPVKEFKFLTNEYDFFSQDLSLVKDKEYPLTVIHNGIVESGCIDEESFGMVGILLISIINAYGSHTALDVYNALVIMSCAFNRRHSATLGIDYWLQKEVRDSLDEIIEKRKNDYRKLYDDAINNRIQIPLGYTLNDFYELKVVGEIGGKYEDDIKKILSSATSYKQMDDYFKFKDSSDLLVKSMGCLGQILLPGNKRIQNDLSWGRRTLSCFPICSSESTSYGHVDEHLIAGLGFNNYFMTAIKERGDVWYRGNTTADPGYFANRLEVLFESAIINYDYTITSNGYIVSTQYGSTSSDPRALYKHDCLLGHLSDEEFTEMYLIDVKETTDELEHILIENNEYAIITIGTKQKLNIKNIDIYHSNTEIISIDDILYGRPLMNILKKYKCVYIIKDTFKDDLLKITKTALSFIINNKKLNNGFLTIDQIKEHYYNTQKLFIDDKYIVYSQIQNELIYCI